MAQDDPQSPMIVFGAYGFSNPGNKANLIDARGNAAQRGITLIVPGLEDRQGVIWESIVRPGIDGAKGFLAFLDEPNANVTFELGYALAKGKRCALALGAGWSHDKWVAKKDALKSFVFKDIQKSACILDLATGLSSSSVHVSTPPKLGTKTLVLSPRGVGGEAYSNTAVGLLPGKACWDDGWSLQDLPHLLNEIGRVVWVVTAQADEQAKHDGDNAVLGLVAGFAVGHGVPVRVWRQNQGRSIADVKSFEDTFDDQRQFESLVPKLPPVRPTGGAPTPPDVRERWRGFALERYGGRPGATGRDLAKLVPLTLLHQSREGSPTPGEIREFGHEPKGLLDLVNTGTASLTLTGEAGAGKSTALKKCLLDRAQSPDADPTYLIHANRLTPSPWSALAEDLDVDQESLEEAPGSGWFLIDGWDELDGKKEAATHAQITKLIERGFRVVIASRPVGEVEKRFPSPSYRAFRIQPLSPTEQRQELVLALGDDGAELWNKIQDNPSLAELTGTPLVLSLLIDLRRAQKPVPRRQGDLYEAAVRWYLERPGQRDRDGADPAPLRWSPSAGFEVLKALAFVLHRDHPGTEAWAKPVLYEALVRAQEEDSRLSRHLAPWQHNLDAFLDDLRALPGFLAPSYHRDDPWAFPHRSFREFLAAAHIRDGALDRVEGVLAGLKDDKKRAHWSGALVFYAGLAPATQHAETLDLLGQAGDDLVAQALPQMPDLALDTGLGAFWKLDDLRRSGDLLTTLLQVWCSDGNPRKTLAERMERHLQQSDPQFRSSLLDQALVVYALDQWQGGLPEKDWDRLFTALGRPRVAVELGLAPGAPEALHIPCVTVPPTGAALDFIMGSDQDPREKPPHPVRLRPFRLAQTPVTAAQFARFRSGADAAKVKDRRPATEVTWWEAWFFARWIGGDLPTEAQWEGACRAGYTGDFGFPDGEDLKNYAWFNENASAPQPVRKRQPNRWGLYDMHGNVWEWCGDWYGEYPTEGGPEENPLGPVRGLVRVLRGGSFWGPASWCRAAFRLGSLPGSRFGLLGFRVALPAPSFDVGLRSSIIEI